MGHPLAVQKLETLPEALRPFYRAGSGKDAGKFVFDGDPAEGYELTSGGFRAALETEKADRERAQRELADVRKRFEGIDLSPEDIRKLVADSKAGRGSAAEDQIQAAIKQVEAKHGTEREKWTARERALVSALESALVDSVAEAAMAKAGVLEKVRPLVRREVRARAKVEESAPGTFAVRVRDREGAPAKITRTDGSTEYMSVEELVGSELRREFPDLYQGAAKPGTGAAAGHQGGGGSPGAGANLDALPPADRLNAIRSMAAAGAGAR